VGCAFGRYYVAAAGQPRAVREGDGAMTKKDMNWLSAAEVVDLINAVKEDGDDAISFVVFYKEFVEKGNRRALLDAVYHNCILNNEPLYPWLRLALLYAYKRAHHREIRSWDEVFGKPSYVTAKKVRREFVQGLAGVSEVEHAKNLWLSINKEKLEIIGRKLKIGGRTKVRGLGTQTRLFADMWDRLTRPKTH
jgi:hypothetical protein